MICFNNYVKKGILFVGDINGNFYDFETLKEKYLINGTFLDYQYVLNKILRAWRTEIDENMVYVIENMYYSNVQANVYLSIYEDC